MQYNVHAAKTQLSRLIEAALAGEEVVIAKGSKPAVRLVPVPQSGFRLGMMAGRLGALPQFDALPDDELSAWEGAE